MNLKIKSDIHVCIVSWKGTHDNASFIANQLSSINDHVSIIYSDPNPEYSPKVSCRLIKRPNELFWSDKFKACLNASECEHLLVIHADCKYLNWLDLVCKYDEAIQKISNLGIWAPEVSFTPYSLDIISIYTINNTHYEIVCFIDALVFGFSKAIQSRMHLINYQNNKYGWGIDRIMACHALSINKFLIVDKSIQVEHPEVRGYSALEAKEEMIEFLMQLSLSERIYARLIQSYVTSNIQKKSKRQDLG